MKIKLCQIYVEEINQLVMLGTLSGSIAPDVSSSIVCQFYRVNKDDIQRRGRMFSEKEEAT